MMAAAYFRWRHANMGTFVLCCGWEAAFWIVRAHYNPDLGTRLRSGFAAGPRDRHNPILPTRFLLRMTITASAPKTHGLWCEPGVTRDVLFKLINCTWICGITDSIWHGTPVRTFTMASLPGTTAWRGRPSTTL